MLLGDNPSGLADQQERLALAAYFAGIIDGEGWIGLTKHLSGSVDGYQLRPVMSVHMVSIEAIDYIHDICTKLGLASYKRHWVDGLKRDPSSRWAIVGAKRVRPVLETVRPFLHVKRRQADLVLEFIASREGWIKNRGSGYTDREKQIREEVCALNTKGKNPQRLYAEPLALAG